MAGIRLLFTFAMKRVSPPWLRRLVGGAIMEGIGTPVDTEVDRNVEGVELRFPGGSNGVAIHPDALALIGRERRILRGPGELDGTFALRLRKWWDAHRTRGNAFALLQQMHDFFLATNNVPIQYIANSGTSVTIAADGTFTRSIIAGWSGDGEYPLKWARFFLVFFLDSDTFSFPLVTEGGEPILTEGGESILVTVALTALTAADIDVICSVPREWSAAHIDRIYLVLIPSGGKAWGLPVGIAWGDGGLVWGGDDAVTFTC